MEGADVQPDESCAGLLRNSESNQPVMVYLLQYMFVLLEHTILCVLVFLRARSCSTTSQRSPAINHHLTGDVPNCCHVSVSLARDGWVECDTGRGSEESRGSEHIDALPEVGSKRGIGCRRELSSSLPRRGSLFGVGLIEDSAACGERS